MKFSQYLQDEINERVQAVPYVLKDGVPNEDLVVAKASFGMDNNLILDLLAKRGNIIATG
jgi:hypothetical protein